MSRLNIVLALMLIMCALAVIQAQHRSRTYFVGLERLKKEGKLELASPKPPSRRYRILYFLFGYTALACGVYLLINGIAYSRYIRLH